MLTVRRTVAVDSLGAARELGTPEITGDRCEEGRLDPGEAGLSGSARQHQTTRRSPADLPDTTEEDTGAGGRGGARGTAAMALGSDGETREKAMEGGGRVARRPGGMDEASTLSPRVGGHRWRRRVAVSPARPVARRQREGEREGGGRKRPGGLGLRHCALRPSVQWPFSFPILVFCFAFSSRFLQYFELSKDFVKM
jgi:hypothetical protein